MKFDRIDNKISANKLPRINEVFYRLMVELGVRETNYHVGTGLGGNPFQLLVMMEMHHTLTSKPVTIQFSNVKGGLVWGADYLHDAKAIDLRKKLDEVFPTIIESFKYKALALQALAKSDNLRDTLKQYQAEFPQLTAFLSGEKYKFNSNIGLTEQLIQASIMCQDLAVDLDKNDLSRVQLIGAALAEFPPEIILLSIRRYIQIDRLVKHNLDEDKVFVKCLKIIQNLTLHSAIQYKPA